MQGAGRTHWVWGHCMRHAGPRAGATKGDAGLHVRVVRLQLHGGRRALPLGLLLLLLLVGWLLLWLRRLRGAAPLGCSAASRRAALLLLDSVHQGAKSNGAVERHRGGGLRGDSSRACFDWLC